MRFASAFLLSALFATLAALVAAGTLTGFDQWALDHLMPGGTFTTEQPGLADALVPLYGTHWHRPWSVAANLVTLPASFLVALGITLWRSHAHAVLVVVGTAVEGLCKELLTRPPLHRGALHVTGFDDSFPSGHTLRAVVVAGAVGGPWAAAWAGAAIVVVELAGWHTPTDVLGGLLLGGLGLLGARALRRRRLPRRRA